MKNDKHFWNSKAKAYNKNINVFAHKPYRRMYEFIKEPLTSNMHVLEVGTGTGLVAQKVADKVKSIEATDFSDEMINIAQKTTHSPNIHFSCADIFNLPFNDNQFNAVIVSNVLHIIPEPERALQEIKRVLKPEGLLIASTFLWEEASFFGKIQKFFMKKMDFPLNTSWNGKTYQDFINKEGFTITKYKKIKANFSIGCVLAKNDNK